jgi:glycosyltransferase involved in cell wall biosynthesis
VNVLCLDQFSNIGGGQRSLMDLLPAFSGRGWHPIVATPGDGPFPEMVRKLGFRTHELPREEYTSGDKSLPQLLRYAGHLPRTTLSLMKLARKFDAGVIYVNGPRLMPPAALAFRLMGIPVVFHCHNRLFQNSAITLTGRSLEVARANVIACCEYVAVPLRKFLDRGRLSVIYNGVEKVRDASCRHRSRTPRVGVVGRIESEKGQLEFVKAARRVAKRIPDCRFAIIGAPMFSGDSYYKKVVAASAGLPVEFSGWQDDISQIFANLDLLVVPSTPVEATTRVILEAYSAGVPVAAFASGGIPEVVRNNETGFLAGDRTPEGLADCIVSALEMHPTEITEVRNRARAYWSENFRLDAYRLKVCAVIDDALRRRIQSPGLRYASTDKGAEYFD